jgi:thiol-disulfide isomerase/thioredoxin
MKTTKLSSTRQTAFLTGCLLVLLVFWGLFHAQINRRLALHFLLISTNPREDALSDLAAEYKDPLGPLNRFWASGKVTHRALVAAFLKANAITNPPWFARAEPLLVAGSADADLSVRELSLAALDAQRNPRLFESAQTQLTDVDPMIRLLGVDYLRRADPRRAVPVCIRLLDDPDLRVEAAAELALSRWSGEDFGVRARLAIPPPDGEHSEQIERANLETLRRGVQQRKQWWQLHAKEFPASVPAAAGLAAAEPGRRSAGDFQLQDLEGRKFRLSDLRGKVVLLNFWATWCPACLTEIPDLVALQKDRGQDIAIVGISLDGVPDEEGEDAPQPGESEKAHRSVKAIQAKVAHVVKAREINYRILLDPHGSVGCQFNGGELPTTVILDKQGHVRRRFIGERSPAVLSAMIAQVQE